jgi:hypothetical protein
VRRAVKKLVVAVAAAILTSAYFILQNIELNGGTIEILSQRNVGTTVTIKFTV